jgi:LmeA-like phospholipid-binding
MPLQTDRPSTSLISKVLSPAVQLWLRSQVESVEALDFQIEGSDRQILAGYIPKVAIAARKAIYKGLYLSQIDLTGETIRINLGQILKGKPLKLLNVVPVYGSLLWDETDLNASLKSSLLANALAEFFLTWLKEFAYLLPENLAQAIKTPLALQDAQAVIDHNQVTLKLNWRSTPPVSTTLRTGLSLASGNRLKLEQPHLVTCVAQETSSTQLQDYEVELGADVELQEFRLELGNLWIQGQINMLP